VSDHNDKDDKHDEPETDALKQEETESEVTSDESEETEATDDEKEESDDAVSDESVAASSESEDEVASEASEPVAADEPVAAAVAHSDHSDHDGHGDDHGHGLSHIASTKVLLTTFGALMVLTIITVAATSIDLGSSMNLLVAMVVATIKAGLVCMFFMHLRYDKTMHTVAFLSALLFALLFVSFALMDSSEYQQDIVWVEEAVP
jgi:cytochrome c oxidase subunit 4